MRRCGDWTSPNNRVANVWQRVAATKVERRMRVRQDSWAARVWSAKWRGKWFWWREGLVGWGAP
jgi:hypothetical protein